MNISLSNLMELYIDTLKKCSVDLLEACDEDIEYNIFEEFDIGVVSFLHERALSTLKNANLINEEIANKSMRLRNEFIGLQNSNLWNVYSVKNTSEWKQLLELSDEIKSLIDMEEFKQNHEIT
ncbi:MAG: hypothetical protein FWH05_02710 [Oscillospiraceae bacterium]|nr:hypothetical protein [Oscillospiraceae bacterium]